MTELHLAHGVERRVRIGTTAARDTNFVADKRLDDVQLDTPGGFSNELTGQALANPSDSSNRDASQTRDALYRQPLSTEEPKSETLKTRILKGVGVTGLVVGTLAVGSFGGPPGLIAAGAALVGSVLGRHKIAAALNRVLPRRSTDQTAVTTAVTFEQLVENDEIQDKEKEATDHSAAGAPDPDDGLDEEDRKLSLEERMALQAKNEELERRLAALEQTASQTAAQAEQANRNANLVSYVSGVLADKDSATIVDELATRTKVLISSEIGKASQDDLVSSLKLIIMGTELAGGIASEGDQDQYGNSAYTIGEVTTEIAKQLINRTIGELHGYASEHEETLAAEARSITADRRAAEVLGLTIEAIPTFLGTDETGKRRIVLLAADELNSVEGNRTGATYGLDTKLSVLVNRIGLPKILSAAIPEGDNLAGEVTPEILRNAIFKAAERAVAIELELREYAKQQAQLDEATRLQNERNAKVAVVENYLENSQLGPAIVSNLQNRIAVSATENQILNRQQLFAAIDSELMETSVAEQMLGGQMPFHGNLELRDLWIEVIAEKMMPELEAANAARAQAEADRVRQEQEARQREVEAEANRLRDEILKKQLESEIAAAYELAHEENDDLSAAAAAAAAFMDEFKRRQRETRAKAAQILRGPDSPAKSTLTAYAGPATDSD